MPWDLLYIQKMQTDNHDRAISYKFSEKIMLITVTEDKQMIHVSIAAKPF